MNGSTDALSPRELHGYNHHHPNDDRSNKKLQEYIQRKKELYAIKSKKPWQERLRRSALARWPGYVLIAFLVIISEVINKKVRARDRFFIERDPDLSYPFRPDTVPSWALGIFCGVAPVTIIFATQFFLRSSQYAYLFPKKTKDYHLAAVVLGEVVSLTLFVTNILKLMVGRLRPNFYAYCDYHGYRDAVDNGDLASYNNLTVAGAVGDFANCRSDFIDAHLSFPSGHSSMTFCGMTFLSLFLLHVVSPINFRHHGLGKAIRTFIILVPMFTASLVAATRVIDYRHHVEDTVWGSLIGVFGAYVAFHCNFGYKRPHAPVTPLWGGNIIVPLDDADETTRLYTDEEVGAF